jgi:hypothetical protein
LIIQINSVYPEKTWLNTTSSETKTCHNTTNCLLQQDLRINLKPSYTSGKQKKMVDCHYKCKRKNIDNYKT